MHAVAPLKAATTVGKRTTAMPRLGRRGVHQLVSEGDLGTAKWEPSHQRPSRWGRGAVCAASWTWSERSAAIGQHRDRASGLAYSGDADRRPEGASRRVEQRFTYSSPTTLD